MKGLLIGLTYDLRSDYISQGYAEADVAEFDFDDTIRALESTLQSLGHRPERIGNARALCERVGEGKRWDLVFNVAEGLKGRCRESQVPAILELYDIPYTFSDPLVCALTLDKALAKKLVAAGGLRTPAFAVVSDPSEIAAVRLQYPLFAKPLAEGTSKGIDDRSRINGPGELDLKCRDLLAKYLQPVLVEEFLPGREFTTGILGNGAGAQVIGTMEMVMRGSPSEGRSVK